MIITFRDSHSLTMNQRAGWDREHAEEVLQKKGLQQAPSTQGSVDEDKTMRWGVI